MAAMLDDAREETVSQTGSGEPGTKEAEAFVAALNHSAERVQTLWFSFLTFMVYLAIATGTTTHRMLFLESPLKLPVLNIDLPLLGFYFLTPIIFVVFHFYMLLNLVLLARTAKSFEDALVRALPEDGEAREAFRMRIENTLFVPLLVGGRLERVGINATLLSLIALITLALAPVALMLMFEVKFLPYHSEWITWLHRGLLALDLMLVWTLWPGYRSGWGVHLWPKAKWWLVPAGVLSAVALVYAVAVATFPDERIYVATKRLHGESYRDTGTGELKWRDRPVWYGWVAFSNTLDLHGESLIDDAKLTLIAKKNERSALPDRWEPTLLLKDRDLTEANLSDTDIRQAEFSDTIFNRANLDRAWAEKVHLDKAKLQGASLKEAQLQSASLNGANLQDAFLEKAQLQKALFGCAYYDYSSKCAQLQGAKLGGAQLQGATLDFANLQDAKLDYANLQGASLKFAGLKHASLINASPGSLTRQRGASGRAVHLRPAQGRGSFPGAPPRGMAPLSESPRRGPFRCESPGRGYFRVEAPGCIAPTSAAPGRGYFRVEAPGCIAPRSAAPGRGSFRSEAPGRLAERSVSPGRLARQSRAPGCLIRRRVYLESRHSTSDLEGHKGRASESR
jgi:uncharacterized protein YjbI with pentapeptide repeats